VGSELFDTLAAIRRLSDDFHIRLAGDKRRNSIPEQGMVVDDEDPNWPLIRARGDSAIAIGTHDPSPFSPAKSPGLVRTGDLL
jgi:hypothetical protein